MTTKRIQLYEKKSIKSALHDKLSKDSLAKMILPKLATMLVNLVHIGPRIILRSVFQILRTNIWTRLISALVIASFDLYLYIRKKISRKQLFINLILSGALLVGGTTGWFIGTSAIDRIIADNTILWIISGLIGAGVFSAATDAIGKRILGRFLKTDVEDMVDLFNEEFENMACEYAFSQEEIDAVAKEVHLNKQTCIDCYSKNDRIKYAREKLKPCFERVTAQNRNKGKMSETNP